MNGILLLPAAIWLLALAAAGYARAWKTAAILNGLAIIGATWLFVMSDRLTSLDPEQPELAREAIVFLAMIVAGAGLAGTAMGWLLKAVSNVDYRPAREFEGSSE